MKTNQTEMNRNGAGEGSQLKLYTPAVDIVRDESRVVVYADMPGVDEKNIDIVLEKNRVTIEGRVERSVPEGFSPLRNEYGRGNFYRSFQLTDEFDPEGIDATVQDGVLKLTIPRIAPRKRRITVSAG